MPAPKGGGKRGGKKGPKPGGRRRGPGPGAKSSAARGDSLSGDRLGGGKPGAKGGGKFGSRASTKTRRGGTGHGWRGRGDAPLADPGAEMYQVGLEHGSDLAHFLAMSVTGKLSVRSIRRALAEGRCRVNGKVETYGSRKVFRNDIVSFLTPTVEERTRRFAFEGKRVLYAEHDLIAYDKPPGLPVTPTDAGTGPSLIGICRRELGDLLACHRIDADTSGIVLLARTREVQAMYEEHFKEHRVKKRYLALVRGSPPKGGTHRTGLLLQEQGPGFERWGSGKGQGALLAITRWKNLGKIGRKASLVEVEPATGRTHQIRVHMAELGHPLVGDKVYGDRKDPIHVSRHLLHAERLVAPAPDGEGKIEITAPRAPDLQAAIDQLQDM
ncbi:MAG: RluA family pseudouridine synthase [Planctomycetota bacterium]|jgi:RluA family pseudouridine synthase|nr:RluA family pseudouridine synthase [Planctomycetota bacterium]